MSFVNGTTQFSIAPGATLSLVSAINGTTSSGGDYVGPLVAVAFPTKLNQSLKISTTAVKALHRDGNGLTSRVVYLYTVTNNNSFSVKFVVDKFFD